MCLEYAIPNKEPSGLQVTRLTEIAGSLSRAVWYRQKIISIFREPSMK
uniref:Topless-like protein n=1 Tax=Rhizophora mucronata TaxID=61149 RepID=A0A2P2JNU5_RHIMU